MTLSTSTYAYDGKAKKPGVMVKLNGKTLKNGTDYTVPIQTTPRSEQQRSLSQARAITQAQFLRPTVSKITSRKPPFQAFQTSHIRARISLRALLLNTMAKR